MFDFTNKYLDSLLLTLLAVFALNASQVHAQQEQERGEHYSFDKKMEQPEETPHDLPDLRTQQRSDKPVLSSTSSSQFDSTKRIFQSDVVHPFHSVALDVNGDGLNDVISGSAWNGEIMWYENLGSGQFSSKNVLSTELTRVYDLEKADVDGDGNPDLVVSGYSELAVFLNDGSGSFSGPNYITRDGNDIEDIELADVNGNGSPDIVTLHQYSDELIVYANDSNGQFSASDTTNSSYDIANDFETADMNGDGSRDLVVTASYDSTISWFANQGSGSFGTEQVIDGSIYRVRDLELANVDSDTSGIDVITYNGDTKEVIWISNDGDGNFGSKTAINSNTDLYFRISLAHGDMTGDGNVDVALRSRYDHTVVFKNDGSGNFTSEFMSNDHRGHAYDLDLADLTGDGTSDYLVTLFNDKLKLGVNDGTGTISDFHSITRNEFADPRDVEGYDMDNDGDKDPVATLEGSNKVSWIENTGSSTFGSVTTISDSLWGADDLEFADIDGDGNTDLIVGGWQLWFLQGDGNANFGNKTEIHWDFVYDLVVKDLDNDGDTDLVTIDYNSELYWHENDGSGNFTTHSIHSNLDDVQSVRVADVNHDGLPDVLTAEEDDDRIAWFENLGGSFGSMQTISTAVNGAADARAMDINNDGLLDVLAISNFDDELVWFANQGSGQFGSSQLLASPTYPLEIKKADLNRDGDTDIIVRNWLDHFWYANQGDGSFSSSRSIGQTRGFDSNLEAVDLNGDVMPDILRANYGMHALDWNENAGEPPATIHTTTVNQIDPFGFPDLRNFVMVTDSSGRPVPGLDDSNFDVMEDSVDQTVRSVDSLGNPMLDLSAALVLDRSSSMDTVLSDAKSGAKGFVDQLDDGDRGAVVSFADSGVVDQPFTTNTTALDNAIDNLSSGGTNTTLYDGVNKSLTHANLQRDSRAVIVLTNGTDDGSDATLSEVVNRAQSRQIPVFTIGIGSAIDTTNLQQLSDDTGGRFYTASGTSELPGIYDLISSQLNSQYKVTYETGNTATDSSGRSVSVTAANFDTASGNKAYTAPDRSTGPSIKPVIQSTPQNGQTFRVDVKVGDTSNAVSDLFANSFELTYDTSLVNVVEHTAGSFLGSNVIFSAHDQPSEHSIGIGVSRSHGQNGVDGNGVVASVKFKVDMDASGGTTLNFGLKKAKANNSGESLIVLSPESDSADVQKVHYVWPGDANNDGVTDEADVLPIGLHWNATGPARDSVSTSWEAHISEPWSPTSATFANANGDTIVNQSDVLAIGMNWGKTHSGQTSAPSMIKTKQAEQLAGKLDLQIREQEDRYIAEVRADVQNDQKLMGASFTFHYEPEQVAMHGVNTGSWLGDSPIRYVHHDEKAGKVSVGLSKRAGEEAAEGDGVVASLQLEKLADRDAKVDLRDGNASLSDGTMAGLKTTDPQSLSSREVPDTYSLSQNYPNPFNPSTKIEFGLPERSDVRLTVYTVTGRKVATLVDETRDAGSYEVRFDASQLASGVYFYRLEAAEFTQTHQMMLVK